MKFRSFFSVAIILLCITSLKLFSQDKGVADSSVIRDYLTNPVDPNVTGDLIELNESLEATQDEIDSLLVRSNQANKLLVSAKIFKMDFRRDIRRSKSIAGSLSSIKKNLRTKNNPDSEQQIIREERKIVRIVNALSDPISFFDDDGSPIALLKSKVGFEYEDVAAGPEFNLMSIHYEDYEWTPTGKYLKDSSQFAILAEELKSINLETSETNATSILNDEIATQQLIVDATADRILLLKQRIQKIRAEIKKKDGSINDLAISVGLPIFAFTILLLCLGPAILRLRSAKLGVVDNPISQSTVLEISTVFLVTTTILILGVAGILPAEILGTLIGAIAGYVLNSARKNAADPLSVSKESFRSQTSTTKVGETITIRPENEISEEKNGSQEKDDDKSKE